MLVALAVSVAGLPAAAGIAPASSTRRATLAITYAEASSTNVDLVGGSVRPGVLGSAHVERKQGRTRAKVHLETLPHPQSLGSFYTTYLLWAVAPEGQAAMLAELPHSKSFDVDVTTSFQTFGLIVTAEPHAAVKLPSPLLVAENVARADTSGSLQTGRLEYGSAVGELYAGSGPEDLGRRDFRTPLLVLGARHAVDLARSAGAAQHASQELRGAEVKLASLEQTWPPRRKVPKEFEGMARDVMRVAEHARGLAVERSDAARLAAERRSASADVARAQSDAERSRQEAERARDRAEQERQQAAAARNSEEQARLDAQVAKANEERARMAVEVAKANEENARSQAERALQEAQQAQRDKAETQRQLFQSLSTILETRREARGLIVSLSDVLFDFDRASLTPGAREKLSKLSGLLLAYPGAYRIDVEGHTDSIGSYDYNMRLSRDRAEGVRFYLLQAGIPAGRMGSASGYADTRPVATNASASGRQLNRRVEIVIGDLER
jgi:outer membrane protein OmpA-like peptidoglycan-associated protein